MSLSFFCGLSLITLAFAGQAKPFNPTTNTAHPTSSFNVANRLTSTDNSIIDPVVKIGTYFDTHLTVQQIVKTPFLQVHTPGDDGKHSYGVHYFKMVVEYASGDFNETEVSGSHLFSPAQLTLIKKLQPGDKLFFETIKGTAGDSITRHYPSFRIHIK